MNSLQILKIFLFIGLVSGERENLLAQLENSSSVGRIEGKLTLKNRDEEDIPRSSAAQPYTLSEKAVVYIETTGNKQHSQSAAKNSRLDQKEGMFRPLVLPIVVGSTVDFPNNDGVFHNVFSYSKSNKFDLGRYPKGETRQNTFDTPGVVSVYCDIHAYMYATILVLDNPFYASPDEDGNYVIDNVPPGTYQLAFWYGKEKVDSRAVIVSGGKVSVVDFVY